MSDIQDIDGKPIKWDDGKVIHSVEGADLNFYQNSIRLLWTKCDRDVPANKAFTSDDKVDCPTCLIGEI